jgi:Tfp pilus assembly protein PilO
MEGVQEGAIDPAWRSELRILIAIMAIAFVVPSAHAQMGMGKGKKHQESEQKQDTAVKADEKAYQDALKKIPAPQEKPDPWKSVR